MAIENRRRFYPVERELYLWGLDYRVMPSNLEEGEEYQFMTRLTGGGIRTLSMFARVENVRRTQADAAFRLVVLNLHGEEYVSIDSTFRQGIWRPDDHSRTIALKNYRDGQYSKAVAGYLVNGIIVPSQDSTS